MPGREPKPDNDLFYLCSLIEFIGRKTKNRRKIVVNAIGREKLQHLYDLADIYHSENIEKIADSLIEKNKIADGDFDNIENCKYAVPTFWDIGKVYKRLIQELTMKENKPRIDALICVYNSPIADRIDFYNSSMYYENPGYIFQSYLLGEPLQE